MNSPLKLLRVQKGLTQKELASMLGIVQGTLSGWETGKYEIDNANLIKLSEIFNVSVDYLIGRETGSDTSKPSEDITFDDFTFAFHNETSSLTEAEKELLLSMARKLNEAKKNGRKAD